MFMLPAKYSVSDTEVEVHITLVNFMTGDFGTEKYGLHQFFWPQNHVLPHSQHSRTFVGSYKCFSFVPLVLARTPLCRSSWPVH